MEMSNEEIVRSYRQAKDKGEQLKILAELNLCSKEYIVKLLREGGVSAQQLPRTKRKPGSAEHREDAPPADAEGESESRWCEKAKWSFTRVLRRTESALELATEEIKRLQAQRDALSQMLALLEGLG